MTGILQYADRGRELPALLSLQDLAARAVVDLVGVSPFKTMTGESAVLEDPAVVDALKDSRSRAVYRSKARYENLEEVATWHDEAADILHVDFTAGGLHTYFSMRQLLSDDMAMAKFVGSHGVDGWLLERENIEHLMFPAEALTEALPSGFSGWVTQRLSWSPKLRGAERVQDVLRCLQDIYHATDRALEIALVELMREFHLGQPP